MFLFSSTLFICLFGVNDSIGVQQLTTERAPSVDYDWGYGVEPVLSRGSDDQSMPEIFWNS